MAWKQILIVFVLDGDFKLFVDNKNWRFVNRSRPSLLKTIYHSLFKYINENRVIRITLVKYVSILQYFSVLYFLLHMIILCLSSFSKKLSSFFLESRVMLCMYTLYFKRCTLYKFIEINSVLFCSVKRQRIKIIITFSNNRNVAPRENINVVFTR